MPHLPLIDRFNPPAFAGETERCRLCGVDVTAGAKVGPFCSRRCSNHASWLKSRGMASRINGAYQFGLPYKGRPLQERFWEKVKKVEGDGCWEWTGCRMKSGYGQIGRGRRHGNDTTHRVSWELEHGTPVPAGMCVCHRCDNPACVRPSHLFLGTPMDNVHDRIAKGRTRLATPRRGFDSPYAIVTREMADEMRRRFAAGETQVAIGKSMGVSNSTVHSVVRGKKYAA